MHQDAPPCTTMHQDRSFGSLTLPPMAEIPPDIAGRERGEIIRPRPALRAPLSRGCFVDPTRIRVRIVQPGVRHG
jgi:hypothetical protein